MKRIRIIFFSLGLLFCAAVTTEAKSPDTFNTADLEYINEDSPAEIEIFVTMPNKTIRFSANDSLPHSKKPNTSTKQKTASKTYKIKNTSGAVIATYSLTSTFQYNGSTSSCTEACCSTSVLNPYYSFNSNSATNTGNTAIGSFTLSSPLQTLSKTLTLQCTSNGTIQ